MAVLHGFEVLPILNEGDERISLVDILALRDSYLKEQELWAVCREGCLAIQSLHNSSDAFHVLCISPESLAFDSNGTVCFLELGSDPEPLYIPPEYETVGNSYKAHVYSLAMTLLFGAEYNTEDGVPRELGGDLSTSLNRMTEEKYEERMELAEVMRLCDKALQSASSLEICRDLASVAKLDVSDERLNDLLLESLSDDLGVVRNCSFRKAPLKNAHAGVKTSSPRQSPLLGSPRSSPLPRKAEVREKDAVAYSPDTAELLQGGSEPALTQSQPETPTLPPGGHVNLRENRSRLNLWQLSGTPEQLPVTNEIEAPLAHVHRGAEVAIEVTQPESEVTSSLPSEVGQRTTPPGGSQFARIKKNASIKLAGMVDSSDSAGDFQLAGDFERFAQLKPPAREGDASPRAAEEVDAQQQPQHFEEALTNFGHVAGCDMENISDDAPHYQEGQSVVEILERLRLGLNESELWALCRQSVAALLNCSGELPAYVSLETVCLQDTGDACFRRLPNNSHLEIIYLAPELREIGLVTEKTCLYGIAAMLWNAADYKMPENQEPALSDEFESLLESMTQDDPNHRPRAAEVMLVCNDYERRHQDAKSRSVCKNLALDARNAAEYGITNVLVKGIMDEDLDSQAEVTHSSVLDAIKNQDLQAQLKPASERLLAERPVILSARDELLADVRRGKKLRKSSKPRLFPVRDIFLNNPELLRGLKRVTSRDDVISPNGRAPTRGSSSGRRLPKTPEAEMPTGYNSTATHFTPIVVETERGEDGRVRRVRDVKNSARSRRGSEDVEVTTTKGNRKDDNDNDVFSSPSDGIAEDVVQLQSLQQQQQMLPPQQQRGQTITPGFYGSTPSLPGLEPQFAVPPTHPYAQYPMMHHHPMMGYPPMMAAPPTAMAPQAQFPAMQIQLRQDPQTGLFQLVPLQVSSGLQQQTMAQFGSYGESQQQHPQQLPPPPVNRAVSHDSGEEARRLKRAQNASAQKPAKPPRIRSEGDAQTPLKVCHETAAPLREVASDARETAKAKFRRERELYRQKAAQQARGEGAALVQNLRHDSSSSPSVGDSNQQQLRRFNSEERLVDEPKLGHPRDIRRARLKRAKSGSSVDYHLSARMNDIDIDDNDGLQQRDVPQKPPRRTRRASPVQQPLQQSPPYPDSSPPLSSPHSKDSGLGAVNHKLKSGDAFLMERLLSNENQHHQQRLAEVIQLLREEFAVDGFLDSGNEDTVIAEYMMSLAGLQWSTFRAVVDEKYKDFYWDEDLLHTIYETINGHAQRPIQLIEDDEEDDLPLHRPDASAFRPIAALPNGHLTSGDALVKPGTRLKSETDFDDDDTAPPTTKTTADKLKSSSMHNLARSTQLSTASSAQPTSSIARAQSQSALDQLDDDVTVTTAAPSRGGAQNYVYKYDSDSSSASERRAARRAHLNAAQHPVADLRGNLRRPSQDSSKSKSSSTEQQPALFLGNEFDTDSIESDKKPDDVITERSMSAQRGAIVYYPAETGGAVQAELQDFATQVDTRTKESIESKMAELDQQMMMEHKQRRKTLLYYKKLQDAARSGKLTSENRTQVSRIARQLTETNNRLDFLNQAKKHLEMLFAEQWGLDHSMLYALTKCPGDEPMLLAPCDNPLLQYKVVRVEEGGQEGLALQAGTPEGLISYLFAQHALSEGFIHTFFYCYRYMLTSADLLDFLMDKFFAAALSLCPEASTPLKVKARTFDIFQVWIEGYFSVDFKYDDDLLNRFREFLKVKVLPYDGAAEQLLEVVDDCMDLRHEDLAYPELNALSWENPELQLVPDEHAPPKKWESFKAALNANAAKTMKTYPKSPELDSLYPARKREHFSLSDHPANSVAEQLTLMEAELFKQAHPVHFLNSKAQGVGVALAQPVISRAQSLSRLTTAWEEPEQTSLFVGGAAGDDVIQRMIEHAQSITLWVSAEILSCSSTKTQLNIIVKFITVARLCQDMRNYATAVSIIEGLSNVIIRQLPAWKSLPAKYSSLMLDLHNLPLLLKRDAGCLREACSGRPTIPCVLTFLLHVQQLEIGGFKLANGMFKWNKMKSIAYMIDQIRLFKKHEYKFNSDRSCQAAIRRRIQEFGQQDLHTLAAQQSETNFHKMSSSKMHGAFKRLKNKLQVRSTADVV